MIGTTPLDRPPHRTGHVTFAFALCVFVFCVLLLLLEQKSCPRQSGRLETEKAYCPRTPFGQRGLDFFVVGVLLSFGALRLRLSESSESSIAAQVEIKKRGLNSAERRLLIWHHRAGARGSESVVIASGLVFIGIGTLIEISTLQDSAHASDTIRIVLRVLIAVSIEVLAFYFLWQARHATEERHYYENELLNLSLADASLELAKSLGASATETVGLAERLLADERNPVILRAQHGSQADRSDRLKFSEDRLANLLDSILKKIALGDKS